MPFSEEKNNLSATYFKKRNIIDREMMPNEIELGKKDSTDVNPSPGGHQVATANISYVPGLEHKNLLICGISMS